MSADRTNVVIVGGGVIGCFIAYFLAKAGARVTLLERGPLCSEASSANAGSLTLSTREGALFQLGQESLRLIGEAQQELGADFDFDNAGSVVLLRTDDEVRSKQAFVQKQRDRGVDVQLLDRQATLELEPAASPEILGAVYSPLDRSISPYSLTMALGAGAQRLGVDVRTGVEVTGLRAEGGRVRAAVTRDGEVAGDFVVIAAGAWSPILARTIGLELPVEPSRGQIVVTEPLPRLTTATIKDTGHIYVRRTGRGNYVIGSMTEKVGFDKRVTLEKLREYVSAGCELVPALKHARMMRAWAGLRPLSADGQPILGPVDGYDGLVLATGHSRTGVFLSGVTGKAVANLITTGQAGFPIDPFKFSRFAGASVAG